MNKQYESGAELVQHKEYKLVRFRERISLELINCRELVDLFKQENAKGESPSDWIIDLSNVAFIDSSGLAALINQNRLVHGKGKYCYLYGLNKTVRQLYNAGGLSRVFEIIDTLP